MFYGFGGTPLYMKESQVNDCFPLNGNIANPSIKGVDQVLDVYKNNLSRI
jgi:hypothetical protein